MSKTALPTCEDCGKELRGRSDKRFCDDTCRNNFNRKKRQAEQVVISEQGQEIITIIKTNYRLLRTRLQENYTVLDESLTSLRSKGFNPNFFSSISHINGEPYYFCFECGFAIDEETITLIEQDQQTRIVNQILFKD